MGLAQVWLPQFLLIAAAACACFGLILYWTSIVFGCMAVRSHGQVVWLYAQISVHYKIYLYNSITTNIRKRTVSIFPQQSSQYPQQFVKITVFCVHARLSWLNSPASFLPKLRRHLWHDCLKITLELVKQTSPANPIGGCIRC